MERLIGSMTPLADGGYAGMMRSALIRTHLELRPGPIVGEDRPFEVHAGAGFLFGRGRQRAGVERAEITMELDAPELPRPITLRARRAEGDEWDLLWTPEPRRRRTADGRGAI